MSVSVAMATYNGEKYIEKQLNSILAQTRNADEVIICDDTSTDSTLSICRRFIEENALTNWRIFENEKNIGYCYNFYKAISKCSGDIIFLADQDDEWYPQKIQKMLLCMEENPEITVLSSRYDVIDGRSDIIKKPKLRYLGKVFGGSIEKHSTESFIGCSHIRGFSVCFRKELKEYIKPIELGALLSHDWLICAVASAKGTTAALDEKLCAYRVHSQNTSLSAKESRQKRIKGICESIEGHKYLATLVNGDFKMEVEDFITFEQKRLSFLQKGNLISFCKLWNRKEYSRYYKGKPSRVWLGDFVYRYF